MKGSKRSRKKQNVQFEKKNNSQKQCSGYGMCLKSGHPCCYVPVSGFNNSSNKALTQLKIGHVVPIQSQVVYSSQYIIHF